MADILIRCGRRNSLNSVVARARIRILFEYTKSSPLQFRPNKSFLNYRCIESFGKVPNHTSIYGKLQVYTPDEYEFVIDPCFGVWISNLPHVLRSAM